MVIYKNLLVTCFSFERKNLFFDSAFNFLYQKSKINKIFTWRRFKFLSFWLAFLFFNNLKAWFFKFNFNSLYDSFFFSRFLFVKKAQIVKAPICYDKNFGKNLFLWLFIHKNLRRQQKACRLLLGNFSKIQRSIKSKFVVRENFRSINFNTKVKNFCFLQQQKTKLAFWFQLLKQIFANNIFTKFFRFLSQTENHFILSQSSQKLVSNLVVPSFYQQKTGQINQKRIFDIQKELTSIIKTDFNFRKALAKRILKQNNVKFLRKKNWRLPFETATFIPSTSKQSSEYIYWFTKKFFKPYLLAISKFSLGEQRRFKALRNFKLQIPKSPVLSKKAVTLRNSKLFAKLSKKFAYEDSLKLLFYHTALVFKDVTRHKLDRKNKLKKVKFYRSLLFSKYLKRKLFLKFFRFSFVPFKNNTVITNEKKVRNFQSVKFFRNLWKLKKQQRFQYFRVPKWKKNKEIRRLLRKNRKQFQDINFWGKSSFFKFLTPFFGVETLNLGARIKNIFHLFPGINVKLFSAFFFRKYKYLFKNRKTGLLYSFFSKKSLKLKKLSLAFFKRLKKKKIIKKFCFVKDKRAVKKRNVKRLLKKSGISDVVGTFRLFDNRRIFRLFSRVYRQSVLLRRVPFLTISYDFYPNVSYSFVEKLPKVKPLFFIKESFLNFFLQTKDSSYRLLYHKLFKFLNSTNSFLLSNFSFFFSFGSLKLLNLQPRFLCFQNIKPLFYCFQSLCFLDLMVKKNIARSLQHQSFLSFFKTQNIPGKIIISTRTNSIFLTVVDPFGVTLFQTTTGSLAKEYRPKYRRMRVGFKRRREIRKTQFKKLLKDIKRTKKNKTKTEEQKRMFLSKIKQLGGKKKKRKLLAPPNRRFITFKTLYPIFFVLEYFLSRFQNVNSKKSLLSLERLKLKLQNKLLKLRKLKKVKTKMYKQVGLQIRVVNKNLQKKQRISFFKYAKPLLQNKTLFSAFSLRKISKTSRFSGFSNLLLRLSKIFTPKRISNQFLGRTGKPTRIKKHRRIFPQRYIPFFRKFSEQRRHVLSFFRSRKNKSIFGFQKFNFYKLFRKQLFFFKKISQNMFRRQFLSFIVILKNFEQKTYEYLLLNSLQRILSKFLVVRKKMLNFIVPHCYSLLFLQRKNING